MMTISDRTILVTGANRGIGRALVDQALRRGARRVYAGTRRGFVHPDPRVTRLDLDVTDTAQIERAAAAVEELDILINNAGIFEPDDLGDRAALDRHLAVNLFGVYEVTQAFLPQLIRARGTIVNNVSLSAIAPIPVTPAYSLSKAAAFSLTVSLRALLSGHGVRVLAALTGPTDTDMVRALDIPKAAPDAVAAAILDAAIAGDEEIFPDPLSQALADGWRNGPAKVLERQNAALAGAPADDSAAPGGDSAAPGGDSAALAA
jgi:NAD(P)-dependent dehydrogenase (short-subunit alcohol dehydrogenase family)